MWRQIHWTHLSTWPLSNDLFDNSLHSWILLEKISFTPYVLSELGMDNSNCTITSNAKRTDASFKRAFFFLLFYRLSKMSFIFFADWLCHFDKDFSYLFGAKFTCGKFHRWRYDIWLIGEWVYIWRHSWNSICQSFFPSWIFNMIQIPSGEISRPQDFIHPSLGRCATS